MRGRAVSQAEAPATFNPSLSRDVSSGQLLTAWSPPYAEDALDAPAHAGVLGGVEHGIPRTRRRTDDVYACWARVKSSNRDGAVHLLTSGRLWARANAVSRGETTQAAR
jgi:hypothetical protein